MTKAKPKTRKIAYVGDHGPVSVPRDGDTDLEFPSGRAVEVDQELAEKLLEQDTFEERDSGGSS